MAFVPLNDDTPIDQYVATGGQTTFAYTWLAFDSADIKVYVNGTLKTLTTDYTISALNQENGANIVFTSGLTLNDAVTITRDVSIKRTTGYTTSGSFRAETLNIEQNKELAISQQLERDIGRTVRLSAFSTIDGANLILPDPQDGYAIVWDGTDGTLRNTTESLSNLEGNASTVASNIASVNTVAGSIANVNTAASNIAAIIAAPTEAANAAASATAAASSATAAAASYDSFDDRYLGAKASDPALDNDGDALVAGAIFFDTTAGIMKVYNGSTWVAAYVSGTDFLAKANNLSDLTDASAARTNLGLVIGTNVQAFDAELAAIAGLTSAADRLPYFTGSGTAALANFTIAARNLLDDASASDMIATLGIATETMTLTNKTIATGSGNDVQRQNKIITTSRDTSLASGTQSITGVGFEPRGVRAYVAASGGGIGTRMSIGYYDHPGTRNVTIFNSGTAAGNFGLTTSGFIAIIDSPGVTQYIGNISAITSDGCTINWTKTGSPTGTIAIELEFWR